MTLPTGTVTLLLGDIEGSTRLWEDHGDAMPDAIASLNAVIDDLVEQHHGARPVEQGEGDSFVAAFSSGVDAVACALALQLATKDSLTRVRIGIHTGDVQLRDAGNYVGPTINRAARIRDAGHGGQVLLSQTTADVVRDALPPDASLTDLGEHRLRDLGRPERFHQLCHPQLRVGFPALRGLASTRNNLPAQVSTFIGREAEVTHLAALVDANRLVTVTGAGGCGKTRLALHVAADRLDAYPGGVWLVDFAPVNDPGAVPGLVLDVLGGTPKPDQTTTDAVVDALGQLPTLLLLDNCEHVIAECAVMSETLARRCSGVTVLATSREPLGIDGETTFRVPSLGPIDAIELFVERAQRTRRLIVDDAATAVIAEICERLDGIPLAIELAASRTRIFAPTQILDGLRDRFRLLTGGSRTAVQRQQTLQASVDWSYALLLEPERVLLQRLSVFAGDFSVEAAEAIASGGVLEPHHVLELLTQLVDKSLVVAEDDGALSRFRMLETIRQYAAARLVDAGDAEAVRQRHFDYFFAQSRRQLETLDEFKARIGIDYDNFRRALQWADDQSDPSLLVRMTSRLHAFWSLGFRLREGVEWLEHALERADTPALRARVIGHCGHVVGMARSWDEAVPFTTEAVALAREHLSPRQLVWTLSEHANVVANVLRLEEADALAREAAELAGSIGDEAGRAFALFQLGRQAMAYDPTAAVAAAEESVRAARASGIEFIVHMSTAVLGLHRFMREDAAGALEMMASGAAGLRESGEGWFRQGILEMLAFVQVCVGDDDGADATTAEGAQIRAGMAQETSTGYLGEALVTAARGQWEETATRLAGIHGPSLLALGYPVAVFVEWVRGDLEALHERVALRLALPPVLQRGALIGAALVERASGDYTRAEDRIHQFLAGGSPALLEPMLRIHALQLASVLAADQGRAEEAVRILGATSSYMARLGFVDLPIWRVIPGELPSVARRELGDARFEDLWAEGAALSWDEVVAYITRGRGQRKRPVSGWASLTPTERQVVDLVAEGLANKEIAAKLFMSVPTVKSHLTHAYAKLGLSSRAELIAAAAAR